MVESVVTPEEFARYADRFLGEFGCEVCNTKAWSLVLDPNRDAGVVYRGDHGGIASLDSCVVACKNCGNIKMFLRDHVEKWVRNNPDG
jgi:hypothetical protein